ncbi:hypothetical protein [Sulfurimonas sp.]|uniref:hypothetical protein n=1 Tax=Sulfurimonas sp. TaxID=2022749 RepID=UPI0025E3F963|nr:hypothetical protein [Sulfurimonas sp.]
MRSIFLLIIMGAILLGAQYSVIISKKIDISSLSSQQLRDLFLQKRRTIGNLKIIPINLVGQDSARTAFEMTVLGMDRDHLNNYWIKQHYQGISPPLTQPSFESIKAFVENVEGALGYIPSSMVDAKVKILYEF